MRRRRRVPRRRDRARRRRRGADPKDLVDFVAAEGEEHERYESWVVSEVERGVVLPGLYPPNEEAKARYEAWKKT